MPRMRLSEPALLLLGSLVVGCSTARNVAVSSFRVLDAPANYVRHQIDSTETTSSPAAQASDVTTPGRYVTPSANQVRASRPSQANASTDPASPAARSPDSKAEKTSVSPPARSTGAQTTHFPTAKAVPGKPGYVYSIDPNGGIVDVTGYKPGDKAKDPYTKQIFIVP